VAYDSRSLSGLPRGSDDGTAGYSGAIALQVNACGLVVGEAFAIDASVIEADASHNRKVDGKLTSWPEEEKITRPAREHVAALDQAMQADAETIAAKSDDEPPGNRPSEPKVTSLRALPGKYDPANVAGAQVKTSGFPERYDRNGDVASYTALTGRRSVSMLRDKPGGSGGNREARPPTPCCSVGLKPASGGVCAVLWTCIEGDDSARRGSMHRIDHGLKHRQAAGRQSNASPDHDAVVSLVRERPLYLGSGCFIGLNQAQVRAPSALGHMLQGQGNAGMDFLGVRARRQYGVSEIHSLWLLPYKQDMRHLIILRVCATSRALLLRGTYTGH
jgi:hypothetical protein